MHIQVEENFFQPRQATPDLSDGPPKIMTSVFSSFSFSLLAFIYSRMEVRQLSWNQTASTAEQVKET